jgi:hypothetical protein
MSSTYKITVQATPIGLNNWQVVVAGTWTPGQEPQLAEQVLSADVVESLFNISPSPTDASGRNEIQFGDTSYAVVYRRLSR